MFIQLINYFQNLLVTSQLILPKIFYKNNYLINKIKRIKLFIYIGDTYSD